MKEHWVRWSATNVRLDWGVAGTQQVLDSRNVHTHTNCYAAVLMVCDREWLAGNGGRDQNLDWAVDSSFNRGLESIESCVPVHTVLIAPAALRDDAEPVSRGELDSLLESEGASSFEYPTSPVPHRIRAAAIRLARTRVAHPIDFSAPPASWWSVSRTGYHFDMMITLHWLGMTLTARGDHYVLTINSGCVEADPAYGEDGAGFERAEGTRAELDRWSEGHEIEVPRCHFRAEYTRALERPHPLDPRCCTTDVVALARYAAESADHGVLPILADALEDAGCTDATVLAHCREDCTHAPRCWVLDAILGPSNR
jgi:hypothetical protein